MTNMFRKIIAYFKYKGEEMEMELDSARLYEGKAILYPKGLDETAYVINSKTIQIYLDNIDENVTVIEKEQLNPEEEKGKGEKKPKENNGGSEPSGEKNPREPKEKKKRKGRLASDHEMNLFKKVGFHMGLYQEEKDEIVKIYKSLGIPRDEFILACCRVAAKSKIDHEIKVIRKERSIKNNQ